MVTHIKTTVNYSEQKAICTKRRILSDREIKDGYIGQFCEFVFY